MAETALNSVTWEYIWRLNIMNPEILEYIRANRARYYREAITAQLIAAGHEQGAVDEAWAAVSAEVEAAAGPNPWPRFRRAFLLTGLVGLAAAFVTWSLAYGTYVNAGYGVVATGVARSCSQIS